MEDITLVELIKLYKQGNSASFMDILNKMRPLIIKYANILRFNDFDDMFSELTLALLECINGIQFYNNEYEILRYINLAITNRFHELYRASKKCLDEIYISDDSDSIEPLIPSTNSSDYSNIIFQTDMLTYITKLPKNKQSIAYSILLEGLSDIEIGQKCNVTRQYVHRLRKQFYDNLANELYK